jgi:hypothetical protein
MRHTKTYIIGENKLSPEELKTKRVERDTIQDINKAGKFFKKNLMQNDIIFDPTEWEFLPIRDSVKGFGWTFEYKKEVPSFKDTYLNTIRHLDKVDILFNLKDNHLSCTMYIKGVDLTWKPFKELGTIYIKNKMHISFNDYLHLVKEAKNARKRMDKIADLVFNWTGLSAFNYQEAVKWGQKLEALVPYMPPVALQFPKNTLYRLVKVKKSAFDKALKGKPLILKNRKYSSWTYSIQAAKDFSDDVALHPDEVFVILRRTFTNSEMLLNVRELIKYLAKTEGYFEDEDLFSVQAYMQEKEIIVKNIKNDFKFTLKDIYKYMDAESEEWLSPKKV